MYRIILVIGFSLLGFFSLNAQIELGDESFSIITQKIENREPIASNRSTGEIHEALNEVFDELSDLSVVTGFNAAIIFPDDTYWKRASGIAQNVPSEVSMETDHIIPMGSITKTFVSATLLDMVEDGLLSLEDSIGMYLGNYQNIDNSATIRQLLNHRTGFSDYINENQQMADDWYADLDRIWEIDTLLENYVLDPNFPVGQEWSYSNTNFILTGKIIEVLTGKLWFEEVRNRIVEPLGLSSTLAYPWEETDSIKFAHAFADINMNGDLDDVQGNDLPLKGFMSMASSAGSLATTAQDLVTFGKRIYNAGILDQFTIDEMTRDYIMEPGNGIEYGLGSLSINGIPENYGHDGSVIYLSILLYFPEYDIAIAVQQNDSQVGLSTPDLYDVLFGLLDVYDECISTSSNDDLAISSLQVYPNPTSENLIIEFDNSDNIEIEAPMEIIDAMGRILDQKILTSPKSTIDVHHLPSGFYYLKIDGVTKKVLITRR